MNERDSFGPHPTHCCARHGCKYSQATCPVVNGVVAQVYPCEECDAVKELMEEVGKLPEATEQARKRWREHIGPTAEEYMAAHPEVDWDTHEVLYTVVNARHIGDDGYKMVTEIRSHWKKPDYEALYAAMREMDEFERVLLRTPHADQVVLRAGYFRQLYADHCKLLALECAGVDSWEGYAEAMAEAMEDERAKEIIDAQE